MILEQQLKVVNEWTREYGQVFTPQNRAQFPSNRDWLSSRAEKLMALLDESSRLSIGAAEKYEEAGRLMGKDEDRRGMALIASAFRKDVEVNQLYKAQLQLASDREVQDEKAYNEKFLDLIERIRQKEKEKDEQFNEGRRLLRW